MSFGCLGLECYDIDLLSVTLAKQMTSEVLSDNVELYASERVHRDSDGRCH